MYRWCVLSGSALIVLALCSIGRAHGGTYKIAGVFSAETGQVESKVFARAVDRVNTDNREFPEVQMQAIPIMLKEGQTWENYLELCRQFESGVVAIVGAESSVEDSLISSVSSAVRIPHIRTGFNRELEDPDDLSLGLAPSPSDLAEVVRELILHMGWNHIVYIYDTSTGLLRMNELEEDPEFKGRRLVPIDLSVDANPWDNIIKLSIRHVVVDIESKSVHQVLKEISMSGLSQDYYSFIMPNSDIRLPENSTQRTYFIDADVYTFSLVDPDNREMHWIYRMLEMNSSENEPNLPFIYDSVLQIGHTLNNLTKLRQPIKSSPGSCARKVGFEDGRKLYDSIRESTKFEGVTGFIEFDDKGARKVKHVHVKLLKDGKLTKVADWRPADGLTFIRELDPKGEPDEALEHDEGLNNRALVVTTILTPPFLMRDDSPHLKGNERYSGFIVDLLEKLSRLLKFQFLIKEVEDGSYGSYNESTGSYNGMIGEILLGKADIAVAPFTINGERYHVLDFSFPFLEAGLGLLARREVDPLEHTFLSPFSATMWFALFCTMVFATFVITFIARLSPREWSSVGDIVIETPFTVGNCFWYLYSTIMFQRFQLRPTSPAVIVAFFAWFIFCLAVMVSYGTVLGDFIIKYNERPALSKIDDLRLENNRVKFSAIRTGSTMRFFEVDAALSYGSLTRSVLQWGLTERAGTHVPYKIHVRLGL
ncbi:glutamate receptor [Tropilaelaps mercedesae]|uniref:Glutamate receptor n=1 Tax=Tropilaelaps mercedesae TaxID=418985 RepID=A0A1V9XPI3_9ACAR|nr:glutamate receptor [Tropilaelaps mercedesae]